MVDPMQINKLKTYWLFIEAFSHIWLHIFFYSIMNVCLCIHIALLCLLMIFFCPQKLTYRRPKILHCNYLYTLKYITRSLTMGMNRSAYKFILYLYFYLVNNDLPSNGFCITSVIIHQASSFCGIWMEIFF